MGTQWRTHNNNVWEEEKQWSRTTVFSRKKRPEEEPAHLRRPRGGLRALAAGRAIRARRIKKKSYGGKREERSLFLAGD